MDRMPAQRTRTSTTLPKAAPIQTKPKPVATVDDLLANLDHPAKPVILALRKLILAADKTITVSTESPKEGFKAFYVETDYEIDGIKYNLSTQLRVLERAK